MTDVRGTSTWNRVEEHFRRLHEPQFGRPHRLVEAHAGPDAGSVVVTGFVLDALEGLPRQAAYALRGGELTPLLPATSSSRQPRLSPDGTQVLVLSDAAEPGVFQAVVLTGLTAVAAPEVPGTVEHASWSPDGRRVLLGVAGRGADLSGGQGSGTTKAAATELPAWHPVVDTGAGEESWRSVWVLDVASNAVRRWSPVGVNVWEAAWCGPDEALVVTSSRPDEGAWYTATLGRLDAAGGLTTLHAPEVQLGWPSASLDGSGVAVVEAVCSDRWVVAGDLLVGTAGGGVERVDTLGVDVTATQWLDGARVGFAGLRGLETVVGVYDSSERKSSELWVGTDTSCGMRHPEVTWTGDGRCVLVEEGYGLPQQVVVLGPEREVLLDTAHAGTDHLLAVGGTAEPVAWSAPDGTRIEGLLCLPAGPGPHPLVVNVHGGPVWSFRNLWSMFYAWTPLLVSAGYAVLNPNPRGSSGRGQAFARQVFGDMGGADTHDFTSGVDALVERGVADPARLGVMGGSYGGYMSSWLVTQDQRWAAAVPTSPTTNWYSQHYTSNIPYFDNLFLDADPADAGGRHHTRSPVMHAHLARTPCLSIAGALDRCTPPTQAQEFHQALLEHGVESQLVVYPQEGHGVRSFPGLIDYCTRLLGWFDTHMPARATAT